MVAKPSLTRPRNPRSDYSGARAFNQAQPAIILSVIPTNPGAAHTLFTLAEIVTLARDG